MGCVGRTNERKVMKAVCSAVGAVNRWAWSLALVLGCILGQAAGTPDADLVTNVDNFTAGFGSGKTLVMTLIGFGLGVTILTMVKRWGKKGSS